MADDLAALATARDLLADAQRIVVLTGAGISTDSGIPDFRGPQGLWTKDPSAEKASDIRHWVSDVDLRRRAWRNRLATRDQPAPQPNDGHRALVSLERTGRLALLVTQNVDGLHLDAGTDPSLLVEIHGTARAAACLDCGVRSPIDDVLDRVAHGEDDPPCRSCGGLLKSATISFGQGLVEADLARSFAAAEGADVLVAIGSTLSVYPIAGLVPAAKAAGARIVIVNGEATEFDALADAVVRGPISDVVPRIVT